MLSYFIACMYHWVVRWGVGRLLFALDTDPQNLVPDYGPPSFLRMRNIPRFDPKSNYYCEDQPDVDNRTVSQTVLSG